MPVPRARRTRCTTRGGPDRACARRKRRRRGSPALGRGFLAPTGPAGARAGATGRARRGRGDRAGLVSGRERRHQQVSGLSRGSSPRAEPGDQPDGVEAAGQSCARMSIAARVPHPCRGSRPTAWGVASGPGRGGSRPAGARRPGRAVRGRRSPAGVPGPSRGLPAQGGARGPAGRVEAAGQGCARTSIAGRRSWPEPWLAGPGRGQGASRPGRGGPAALCAGVAARCS
jgi:hypothetical protein